MTTIFAKSILASQHSLDPKVRGDSLLLRYPRCIHAEFMTHRVFSRNASSSRAIPVEKMIKDVMDDPFIPLHWGKNQKGMQADQECSTPVDISPITGGLMECDNEYAWLQLRDIAVGMAQSFAKAGYHKQIVNRILEPWMHINVLVTSTNWSNFLALRDHHDAEPHIQLLAREVRAALAGADVIELEPGNWHMPFITPEDPDLHIEDLQKLSVARCASTSYKTVEGFDMTLEVAERIWTKLFTPPIHASPFEHVFQMDLQEKDFDGKIVWSNPHLGGNLGPGVIQLRKTLANECL